MGTSDHGTANQHAVIAEGEPSSGTLRADWEGNGKGKEGCSPMACGRLHPFTVTTCGSSASEERRALERFSALRLVRHAHPEARRSTGPPSVGALVGPDQARRGKGSSWPSPRSRGKMTRRRWPHSYGPHSQEHRSMYGRANGELSLGRVVRAACRQWVASESGPA